MKMYINHSTTNKNEKENKFKERFIKKSGSVAREGRQVYISPEFHTKIRRIVAIIGNNEITVHDYIQNVIAEHFSRHKEELELLYRESQLKYLQL